MVTNNFKACLQMILQSGVNSNGLVAAKDVTGATKYLGAYFSSSDGYPYKTDHSIRITPYTTSAGIYLGTSNTPATASDYFVGSVISSGLSAGSPVVSLGVDENGNPYKQIVVLLSNTTASDIVVKEVGYVQQFFAASAIQGSPSILRFLLDRTVLASPLTVPANGSAVLKYTLKTIIS